MQKKIVAVAATVLCASAMPVMAQATGASKVELWGIVDAAVRHTTNEGADKGSLTKMVGGGMSQSRWGLNVEEDLGGGSKALAHLEHRFNADTGAKDVTAPFFQLAYVGLQGPYGRLTMGRQWNVLFDVVTSTYASFPYSPYMDAYKPELGMAAGARTSNALKYTLATPSRNWVGTVQYSFAEGNDNTDAVRNVGLGMLGLPAATPLTGGNKAVIDNAVAAASGSTTPNALTTAAGGIAAGALKTMGGFLRYSENGISVGGGFLRTELPGGSDLDALTFGGSYRSGPLYVNLGYGQNKVKWKSAGTPTTVGAYVGALANRLVDQAIINSMWQGQTNGGFQVGDADKRQMIKVGFGYQVTPQINAGMHYFHAKQSGSTSGGYDGKAHFMVAAVDYAFSKRTDAYVAIDHTKLSNGESKLFIDADSKARSRTGFTVGLRHRF
ncbi:porin [Comamonas aquatica]|uniref:porin n=1 Tax=Comamonas aquatica TaxID=225991 RepID=UPI0005A675CF|nr:porin [Comamonas aquatica]